MWGAAEQGGGTSQRRLSARRGKKPYLETPLRSQNAKRAARDSETDTRRAHPPVLYAPGKLRLQPVTRPPANGSLPPGPGYDLPACPAPLPGQLSLYLTSPGKISLKREARCAVRWSKLVGPAFFPGTGRKLNNSCGTSFNASRSVTV